MLAGNILYFLCNDIKTGHHRNANRGHDETTTWDATTTVDATKTGDATMMKGTQQGWDDMDGDGGLVQQEGNKPRKPCK